MGLTTLNYQGDLGDLTAAQQQTPVDVQKELMRLTVDVTTNLTFGYDMNTLENEGDVIQDHLEMIFPMVTKLVTAPFPWIAWAAFTSKFMKTWLS